MSDTTPITIENLIDEMHNIQARTARLPGKVRFTTTEAALLPKASTPIDGTISAFWGVPVELADPLLIAVAGRTSDWTGQDRDG